MRLDPAAALESLALGIDPSPQPLGAIDGGTSLRQNLDAACIADMELGLDRVPQRQAELAKLAGRLRPD